jgi:hypothetical protein
MKTGYRLFAAVAIACVAGVIFVPLTSAANSEIRLAGSSAYPHARGSAQYQSQPGQAEFQLEVDHIPALAGQRIVIYVNAAGLGTVHVSQRGVAELNRNSELGQRVPSIHAGTGLTVATSSGVTVASGAF